MRSSTRCLLLGSSVVFAALMAAPAAWAGDETKDSSKDEASAPAQGDTKNASESSDGASDDKAAEGENKDKANTEEKKTDQAAQAGQSDQTPPAEGENKSDSATEQQGEAAASDTTPAQSEPSKPDKETLCTNGTDDDGDGTIDCADSDCAADPACQAPPLAAGGTSPQQSPPNQTQASASFGAQGLSLSSGSNGSPGADKGTTDTSSAFHPPAKTFALEGDLGISNRLAEPDNGHVLEQRSGLQLGGGFFFAPSRSMAFGARYLFADWGTEKETAFHMQGSSVRVHRKTHTIQAGARLYPYQTNRFRAWLGLFVGAIIDKSQADGLRVTNQYPKMAHAYQVDVDADVGFIGTVGLGMDYDLTKNTGLLAGMEFSQALLSSDPQSASGADIPVTISGAGSTPVLDFKLGLQYRFDLTGSSKAQASANVASR